MRKAIFLFLAGLLVWGIGCQKDALDDENLNSGRILTPRATEAEIENAINNGITWLLTHQNSVEGWFYSDGYYENAVALTGLAVTKLCDRCLELGYNPDDEDCPYFNNIQLGINFILSQADPYSGTYLLYQGYDHYDIYNTGIGAMAIASYRCPDCIVGVGAAAGMTHKQLLDEVVEYFDLAQTPMYGPGGGWQYNAGSCCADNSNSGFAALGLLSAKEFGCVIPQGLIDAFSPWLDYIQNDVSGGSGYQDPDYWVNVMKTGNLLFEFALCGDAPESPRVQSALGYLSTHWDDVGASADDLYQTGWKPSNFLAMYCLMKGFVSMGIESINVGGSDRDWFDEISSVLVSLQQPGGYWDSPTPWLDPYLSTAFNLLTLEKITPVAIVDVSVDIKPGSCPNPFNRTSNGVVPVAVLGDEDFDVTLIDPATVNIEGVSPVNWNMDDVATPYNGELEDKNDCHILGADGYTDLLMHFNNQALAALLSGYNKGDVVVLTVEGELTDGRQFQGEDIIWIVK